MSILTKPPSQKPDKPGKVKKQKAAKPPKGEKPAKGEVKPAGRRRASITHASVNLLSPWVLEEIKVRGLRLRFVLGALVLLMLMAATWGALRMNLANAEKDLRSERAAADSLSAQISDMSDVSEYVGNVTVRSTSVEGKLAREVAYSSVLRTLDQALPDGAAFDSVVLTLAPDPDEVQAGSTTPEDAVCPGPDPFGSKDTVGCVVLSGTADSRDTVTSFVQALNESDLFVEPFISTTAIGDGESGAVGAVEFVGSVAMSRSTFTQRYADVDGSESNEKQESDR